MGQAVGDPAVCPGEVRVGGVLLDITTHRHPTPVLCVHGIGIDHRNNDMVPQVSIARHLREAGHDVWLLRLRSGGTTRKLGHGRKIRFRTLGCYPLSGGIESEADTLTGIIQEMLLTRTSERQGRLIDHDQAASMEKKKQEGYF